MPADDVSDLRDVVDAINRLCDTMKTSQCDDAGEAPPAEPEATFRPIAPAAPPTPPERVSDLATEIMECIAASPEVYSRPFAPVEPIGSTAWGSELDWPVEPRPHTYARPVVPVRTIEPIRPIATRSEGPARPVETGPEPQIEPPTPPRVTRVEDVTVQVFETIRVEAPARSSFTSSEESVRPTEVKSEAYIRPIVTSSEEVHIRKVEASQKETSTPPRTEEVPIRQVEVSQKETFTRSSTEEVDSTSSVEASTRPLDIADEPCALMAQRGWSDSLSSLPAEAGASEPYYTASEASGSEEEARGRELVVAGHVAAMRERFESLTRAPTPCPDALTPEPDKLG